MWSISTVSFKYQFNLVILDESGGGTRYYYARAMGNDLLECLHTITVTDALENKIRVSDNELQELQNYIADAVFEQDQQAYSEQLGQGY